MGWLLLLLALGAFVAAFLTTSVALVVVLLMASLVLLLAGVVKLLADRVGARSRDEAMMVDPAELRRLREQAQVRRGIAAGGDTARSGTPDHQGMPTP